MALPPPLPPSGTPRFGSIPSTTRRPTAASGLPAGPPPGSRGLPGRVLKASPSGALPDPKWLDRTAPSDTPGGPWVVKYRIWKPGVYRGGVVSGEWWIDLQFKSGYKERWLVPAQTATAAAAQQPTGVFVRRVLLGPKWTAQNKQSRYQHFPI